MGSTALLSHSTPRYALTATASDHVLTDQPSHVRVFIKALHLLSATWVATVAYLLFFYDASQLSSGSALTHLLVPAILIESCAVTLDRWTHRLSASSSAHPREWSRAFAWSAFPIVMLAGTAWLMTA